ncbi:MAG: type I 3-dehydroquinate dehydratase [Verrucomicrobiota bacterium]|nr:type I 3-dehydroquinate dehydratase [Verrucomicrobiota bacterium]
MTPQIVGVIFSRADFHRALRMRTPPDLFELRLDRLANCIDEVKAAVDRLPAPFIITARDPREGGANHLSSPRRRALLLHFLPHAAYVDVEFRAACALAPVLRSARAHGIPTIISFHDFKTTPRAPQLDEIVSGARALGAYIVKVATRTDTPAQLDRLFDFFERHRLTANIVPMGIGKLGRISRLELARRGCRINYAHLGSPTAAGQLSIQDLRRALG